MNSKYTTDRKSTEELRQQVLQDLKKVREDFDEIKQRMTPGQLIDDAIYYRHDRTPAATFEHLKANPVGTAFLTLGTLLLMEDKDHHSYEGLAREKAHMVSDKVGNAVHSAQEKVHQVQDKLHHAQNKAVQMKDTIKAKVSKAGSGPESLGPAEDYAESMGFGEGMDLEGPQVSSDEKLHTAKEKLGSKLAHMKTRTHEMSETVKAKTHEAVESAKHLDPLTYIALGAGLGTITGAALPVSVAESKMIDAKFESNLYNFGQELQDALNESVNILKNEFIGGLTEINMQIF